ncbi:MAG TPA: biopolymer transporter ExbD [Candidatus Krumholzibacteria bacterium]|nr:biopolymer transporter ExbD [Candidatus Krumholzibacteria bacterium]
MGAGPNWNGGGTNPNHDVNMVPLIDVSLVLVVMLLLATPLAFESRIDVANASKTGQQAQKTEKSERVEIEIMSAEQVRVNRIPVAVADLSGVLTPLVATSADRGVLITCGKDVPHGSFVHVLDITKQCGTAEISVIER